MLELNSLFWPSNEVLKYVTGNLCHVDGFDNETPVLKLGSKPTDPEPNAAASLLLANIP